MKAFMKKSFLFVFIIAIICSSFCFISYAKDPIPNTRSRSICVLDMKTGQILYSKNIDDNINMLPSNTISCIMTSIENPGPSGIITVPEGLINAQTVPTDTANIMIKEGEQLNLNDLYYAVLLENANDAMNVIANNSSSDIQDFVEKMNDFVKSTGCTDTSFTSLYPLDIDSSTTTVNDMIKIARTAWNNDLFKQIVSTSLFTIKSTNKNSARTILSRCLMLDSNNNYYYENATSGMGSWTKGDGYSSIVCASKNGIELMCIISGCSEEEMRWAETKELFEYFYNNYNIITLSSQEIGTFKYELKNNEKKSTSIIKGTSKDSISFLAPNSLKKDDIIKKDIYDTQTGTYSVNFILNVEDPLYKYAGQLNLDTTINKATLYARLTNGNPILTIMYILGIIEFAVIIIFCIFFIWLCLKRYKLKKNKPAKCSKTVQRNNNEQPINEQNSIKRRRRNIK